MKTEREIEELKLSIQGKISDTSTKATEAFQASDKELYELYDREYAKYITQYNILSEVLKG